MKNSKQDLCSVLSMRSTLCSFTAPDLSQIAQNMDELEASYDDQNTGQQSTNMDDTGFFSVQVLEKALNVWGLHTQLAFILNCEQHWFTLRRFGPAEADMAADPGDGHWYNLNSGLPAPEWVGKLYLGMVLQQAESEGALYLVTRLASSDGVIGYSVFAVVQIDPTQPLALTRTDADDVAATLPEPSSSSARAHISTARTPTAGSASASTSAPGGFEHIEGFEDEDMELQAALQASLGGGEYKFTLPLRRPTVPAPPPLGFPTGRVDTVPDLDDGSDIDFPNATAGAGAPENETTVPIPSQEDEDSMDPVARSMLRNKRMLERMKREQEYALREQYESEVAGSSRPRRQAEEEEEENIRRAIAESEAMARTYARDADAMDEDSDDGDEDYVPPAPSRLRQASLPDAVHPQPDYMAHRVYDDDDAELQAALKASLEHMPEGFTVPEAQALPSAPPLPRAAAQAPPLTRQESVSSVSDAGTATSAGTEVDTQPVQEQKVDLEEMRRRRLARFG
ncbi:hypothetical protein HWV62_14370 [Athelia sp. TMB]|nr:hypothetical protein HWV62_14370 [Athelia sp. TMB]